MRTPTDSGGDNVYDVTLGVSAGGQTATLDVAVTVTNKEEGGAVGLSSPQPQADADFTATLGDPDNVSSTTWTWERSTSRSGPWMAVSGATSSITTSVYRPVAGDVGYFLRVNAAYIDGHAPDKSRAVVSGNSVRAAPVSNVAPSFDEAAPIRRVAENARARAAVEAPVTATDTDSGDVVTYELSGSDLFTVGSSSGQIRVAAGGSLSHETAPSHSVTVKASDPSNASDTVTVTIEVTDANEPPDAVADTATVREDGVVIIDVLANDSDPEHDRSELTLRVTASPRRGSATVNEPANVGERRTITYTPRADYHGADSFTYEVRDTGSPSLSSTATVSVEVDAVNDPPTFASPTTTRTVSKSASGGGNVGAPVTAADVDEDDPLTYSVSGADARFFDIGARSGQITVGDGVIFDIAMKDTYIVTVDADDTAGARATVEVTVTVTSRPVGSTGPTGPTGPGGGGGGGDLDVGVAAFVVANGWSAADVGAASVLAARTDGAVVVYTAGGELSAETAMLLREAAPAEVVIVGGTGAVSRDVRSQIRAASPESGISRISGADRADTAAGTARRILGAPSQAGRVTLIVANGWSPPDIGAAAALAARSGRSAVVYTQAGRLSEASAALLREYEVARVTLIGGTAAISQAVQESIAAAAGGASISRLTGDDRIDTAAQAARCVLGNPAAAPDGITLVIANGWSAPDVGVAAALAAANENSAVAYTSQGTLPAATAALIRDYRPDQVIIVGGRAAVANDVRAAITEAAPSSADVRRITGSTRTDTAARAARRILGSP